MPTFQVRNRRTKIVLGEVTVEDPTKVLDSLKDATDCSIEEIATSLGSTVEEATAALDIVELKMPREAARSFRDRATIALRAHLRMELRCFRRRDSSLRCGPQQT